ncbi:MAG TPA: hypothetical protein VFL27_11155 [Candidatus Dormibacteraeota bacterium]|nr:hypothetical protein [Candidatus Dormibacteraeota bacterium]
MKGKGWLAALGVAALVGVFVPGLAVHRARADTPQPPNVNLALETALLGALPAPADDPLLDASGNPVLDASGNPVSDPNEGFHAVIPRVFDPGHTFLVQSVWITGMGCPTSAQTFDGSSNMPLPADTACPTGDSQDVHNEGLLLAKTGPTANFASGTAELKKVRGQSVTELGYDLKKPLSAVDPRGSHCGAGAPRFDVITSDGVDHFVGCNSPPAMQQGTSPDWTRLRWGPTQLAAAFPPILPGNTVSRIVIVFDEGTDTGPDNFGAAVLDNVDFNSTLVGRGATG